MRRIVQPSRRATRMRQRDVDDAILHARAADGIFQRDLSPEAVDGETAEEEDHPRSEQRELLVEPRPAERDLGVRRSTIAASRECPPRKALRDRRAIRQVIFVDASFGEPAPKLGSGAAAEGLADGHLNGAGSLADDRDAIANGSGDDRPRLLQVSGVDALRAGADVRMKPRELETVNFAIARA